MSPNARCGPNLGQGDVLDVSWQIGREGCVNFPTASGIQGGNSSFGQEVLDDRDGLDHMEREDFEGQFFLTWAPPSLITRFDRLENAM